MRIGVPKETKVHEYRVGLLPDAARELATAGHDVLVERGAGAGVGADDGQYERAGATVVRDAAAAWAADLVVKIKEPQPAEYRHLRAGQVLFTYLHLAADRAQAQAQALCASGVTAIAYETVTDPDGGLPLLVPMSEVAGRMAIQVGAACLEKARGGRGILLGGAAGVAPARVAILGGGVAGTAAAGIAIGMGADVTVIDRSAPRLRELARQFGHRLKTQYPTGEAIGRLVAAADLVVGAVLVPGAAAPRLVTRAMLDTMQPGAVIVDIAIDQGGCTETSRPTTHAEPTYRVGDIVHYCVTNMPGAVPLTSSQALGGVTLPFVRRIADAGATAALQADPHLRAGLNVHGGRIVHAAVAASLGVDGQP